MSCFYDTQFLYNFNPCIICSCLRFKLETEKNGIWTRFLIFCEQKEDVFSNIQLTSPAQQMLKIVPTYSLTACATMSTSLTNGAQSGSPNSSPDCVAPPLRQLTRDQKDRRDSIRVGGEELCRSRCPTTNAPVAADVGIQ